MQRVGGETNKLSRIGLDLPISANHWLLELLHAGTRHQSGGNDSRLSPFSIVRSELNRFCFHSGGREGNNAFLKFEATFSSDQNSSATDSLIESGLSYKEFVKLSKEQNLIPSNHFSDFLSCLRILIESTFLGINTNYMDSKVVVAARLGMREMASALAEGPAKSNMNDLHRETLK